MSHTVFIRNMVCNRCKMIVEREFQNAGLKPMSLELGLVELDEEPSDETLDQLQTKLQSYGFDIIEERNAKLVSQLKSFVIGLVQNEKLEDNALPLSKLIEKQFHKDYDALSRLFSSMEQTTLEKFFIAQKIEKVKEWLAYDEMPLKEMAVKLGYSSTAHLSNQFKQHTGMSPAEFRRSKQHRTPLDEL